QERRVQRAVIIQARKAETMGAIDGRERPASVNETRQRLERDGIHLVVRARAIDKARVNRTVAIQPGQAVERNSAEVLERATKDDLIVQLPGQGQHRI